MKNAVWMLKFRIAVILSVATIAFACNSPDSVVSGESGASDLIIAKTKTTFRLLPDGSREMELIEHFDSSDFLVHQIDHMKGEVYLEHFRIYDEQGRHVETNTYDPRKDETYTSFFEYAGERLIRSWNGDVETTYEYDERGCQIIICETDTLNHKLNRFKLKFYDDDQRMIEQQSFKRRNSELWYETVDENLADSLVQPYHVLRSFYRDGKLDSSVYSGAVDTWFQIHNFIYDENGELIRVKYSAPDGESGGSREYEYTYH